METAILKTGIKKYPPLRFRDFEEKLKKKEFGLLAERSKSKYNPINENVSFPCIELDCLSQETGSLIRYYDSLEQKSIKNKFKKGDILFGKLRPYLKKFLKAPFEGVCSSEIWVLNGIEISNEYLYQLIQTEKFNFEVNITSGSKMPRAEWSYISEVPFRYPSLPEQQKIASFLSAVDKKIRLLTRKKELLETYKKGVMQKLFSQEISFKDQKEKEFPEWKKKRYGEVYSFLTTNSFSRNDLNYEEGSVKNIHYGDIHTKFPNLFHLTKENVPFINGDKDISKINPENFCQEGDQVIADASEDYKDIGKTIEIIDLNGEKVLAGLHTFLARPKSNIIYKGFSGYLVQNWSFRKQVMTIAQGTKVLGLSTGRMKKLKVEIPSKPEQQKIADFLSSIDKKIEAVSQQINKTQSFKKGLLQQMFV